MSIKSSCAPKPVYRYSLQESNNLRLLSQVTRLHLTLLHSVASYLLKSRQHGCPTNCSCCCRPRPHHARNPALLCRFFPDGFKVAPLPLPTPISDRLFNGRDIILWLAMGHKWTDMYDNSSAKVAGHSFDEFRQPLLKRARQYIEKNNMLK